MTPTGVYLDHAATTPVRPEVVAAVVSALELVGNPSSLHGPGRAARRLVEESRERIAAALACDPIEVIFTGSGTEANNLAIKGIGGPVAVAATEHHAVLDPAESVPGSRLLPVDGSGRVQLDDELNEALVSVMWVNNEVGTVQPLAEVVDWAGPVPVHSDAVQALGHVPVAFADSGLAAMTISGHKIGGPMGVGALIARRDLPLQPLLHGGGQERDLRSGTLDVASIAGFAVAVEMAVAAQPTEAARLRELRAALVQGVAAAVPDVRVPGEEVAPHLAHFGFPGCEGDALLLLLDAEGVSVSTGSACRAGLAQPSHVLLAMGQSPDQAREALRVSLGWTTTAADVEAFVAAICPAVERARGALAVRRA